MNQSMLCGLKYALLLIGDAKRAEDHFRAVHNVATKGQSALKKKFLFCSLLGMVILQRLLSALFFVLSV